MEQRNLVVFDMDGTLNQIEWFIIPTYEEVLDRFAGAAADRDTVMRLMGCVDEEIYQGLLPGAPMERFDEFMALTVEAEYRNIDRYAKAFDGVEEMLKTLTDRGYVLAVCTNGTNGYVRKIVKALGIETYFTYLQGAQPNCTKGDTLGMVLEKIRPHKAVMVGDRSHDWQAARQNHLPFVGCQYGYLPQEVEKADLCVRTVGEIPAAVEKLMGCR